jgi:AraC family transcriptional regulator, regulatory protein of adaptative response / methylated-DNA-[protein]-cysteine methyltransferase
MTERTLPPSDEMYGAVLARDTRYDGIFFTAVKTTGIFCRPSCPAKKPERRNVEFHASAREALAHGFRPCKRCRPLELPDQTPPAIQGLLAEVEADPARRLPDRELRERGLDPAWLRRWFKDHHGMTFQAYQRARRLANAIGELAGGAPITHAAYANGYESLSGFQEALRQITGRSASRSRVASLVHLSRVLTPLGPMLMGTTDAGVCLLEFADRRMLETQLKRLIQRTNCVYVPGRSRVGEQLEAELGEYFAGRLQEFRTPVVTPGSEFQQRVWSALREIPYGGTRSYADQARMIEAPSAVRAVARANGDNRIAIVIPCHRVIGADGSLTGYGGGLWRKRWLLHHEGAALVAPAGPADPSGAGLRFASADLRVSP